jgi:hypothetical protein
MPHRAVSAAEYIATEDTRPRKVIWSSASTLAPNVNGPLSYKQSGPVCLVCNICICTGSTDLITGEERDLSLCQLLHLLPNPFVPSVRQGYSFCNNGGRSQTGQGCAAVIHASRVVPQPCLQRLHREYEFLTACPDLYELAVVHAGHKFAQLDANTGSLDEQRFSACSTDFHWLNCRVSSHP